MYQKGGRTFLVPFSMTIFTKNSHRPYFIWHILAKRANETNHFIEMFGIEKFFLILSLLNLKNNDICNTKKLILWE
ncbi:Ovule protein [Flavobacterium branchiophilum]